MPGNNRSEASPICGDCESHFLELQTNGPACDAPGRQVPLANRYCAVFEASRFASPPVDRCTDMSAELARVGNLHPRSNPRGASPRDHARPRTRNYPTAAIVPKAFSKDSPSAGCNPADGSSSTYTTPNKLERFELRGATLQLAGDKVGVTSIERDSSVPVQ